MQSNLDNNRWIFQIFCHSCGKEYRDSFSPDSCDYCGSGDLTVATDEGNRRLISKVNHQQFSPLA